MCGIAGLYRRTDKPLPHLETLVDELLRGIADRGSDATGCLTVDDQGRVDLSKRPVPVEAFIKTRSRLDPQARTVLLHTRFATTGSRHLTDDAHPVQSGPYYAVHNGTIWNADELFETFKLVRHARVDSEVIPALAHFAGAEHLVEVFSLMTGGAAAALVSVERPRECVLARTQDYPLVYVIADDFIVWASTASAIRSAWKLAFERYPKKQRVKNLSRGCIVKLHERLVVSETFKPRKREPLLVRSTSERWDGSNLTLPSRRSKRGAYSFSWNDEYDDIIWDMENDEDEDADLDWGNWCDSCGDWDVDVVRIDQSVVCRTCAERSALPH